MTTARDSTMTLDTSRILALAAEIRRVDGGNKSGAAELAERLMPFIDNRLATRDAVVSDEEVANAWDAFHMYVDDRDASMRAALESFASRNVAVLDGWPKGKYGYTRLFNAIGSAVEWKEHKTLGISVAKFEEAMLAPQDEVK